MRTKELKKQVTTTTTLGVPPAKNGVASGSDDSGLGSVSGVPALRLARSLPDVDAITTMMERDLGMSTQDASTSPVDAGLLGKSRDSSMQRWRKNTIKKFTSRRVVSGMGAVRVSFKRSMVSIRDLFGKDDQLGEGTSVAVN